MLLFKVVPYKWCVVTIIIAIFAWVLLGVPGVALPYGGS